MAITAYTGIMGSGKSYEVVENVILPALLAGRRIVSNVAGLQVQEMYAYLIEKFDADTAKLGTIVQIANDQVAQPGFFPVEVKDGETAPDSTVQGGDLVVIDECWRWWATGCKIQPGHMTFFRMHRHFTNAATSGTCDVVLVVQDIGDLDRKVKVVVETTYRMTKHKALGKPSRYRVDVYAGYKMARGTPKIREMQRKYDPDIFKLYSSYSQSKSGGKEGVVDGRANILRGAFFKLVLPCMFIFTVVAGWLVYRFFHPESKQVQATGKPGAVAQGAAPGVAAALPRPGPPAESEWRVKGYYMAHGHMIVLLSRAGAVQQLIDPAGFMYDGFYARGTYYDKLVTNYTGTDDTPRQKSIFSGATK